MTYKICFWNEKTGEQDERDSIPDEDAQMKIDIANNIANPVKAPLTVDALAAALLKKGTITEQDLQPVQAEIMVK